MLFANFAEAMAEGRGKAQADTLRGVAHADARPSGCASPADRSTALETVAAERSARGDFVLCTAGRLIPGDGEVVEGVASVDESAITGESAPVIRESGGDRSAVTGGTKVLSDYLVIRITANPGETFIDRMIALVEGAIAAEDAERDRADDPAVRAHDHLPVRRRRRCSRSPSTAAAPVAIPVLIALLVCLIPTTIGGLLSAIGIAGMDRMIQQNVIAMSGRAVEAAGDVNTLLLDKTGTITLGNRQAVGVHAAGRRRRSSELADRAQLASLPDETPEGPQHRGAGQGASSACAAATLAASATGIAP